MIKTLWVLIMLGICGTTLFAQTETDLLPLPSEPFFWYMPLVQPPLTSPVIKIYIRPPPEKQRSVFSLDIPILPRWDTVKEDRVKSHTIQFGETTTPWRDTVIFGGWPVPRVTFTSPNFRVSLEGGIMKALDENSSRTMKQVHMITERGLWYVLIGTERFFGQEEILRASKGLNFESDFRRRSYGGQWWLGLKVGDFNRSFIAGRYGKGYVRTEGLNHFNVPSISNLDWFLIYLEEFKTKSFSIDGKVTGKRISQSVRFDRIEYERLVLSPDPLRFGENHLEDMWLRTETEVAPFPRARFLRGVVVLTKDFRNQNRLMFINDYSSMRVLLRLAF